VPSPSCAPHADQLRSQRRRPLSHRPCHPLHDAFPCRISALLRQHLLRLHSVSDLSRSPPPLLPSYHLRHRRPRLLSHQPRKPNPLPPPPPCRPRRRRHNRRHPLQIRLLPRLQPHRRHPRPLHRHQLPHPPLLKPTEFASISERLFRFADASNSGAVDVDLSLAIIFQTFSSMDPSTAAKNRYVMYVGLLTLEKCRWEAREGPAERRRWVEAPAGAVGVSNLRAEDFGGGVRQVFEHAAISCELRTFCVGDVGASDLAAEGGLLFWCEQLACGAREDDRSG
jgi:hypothetical protein